MTNNEKGNLSGVFGATATSGILLEAIREVMLMAARIVDPNVIDKTRDQKYHRVRVYGVELE